MSRDYVALKTGCGKEPMTWGMRLLFLESPTPRPMLTSTCKLRQEYAFLISYCLQGLIACVIYMLGAQLMFI